MASAIEFNVELRKTGKGASRTLRKDRKIPAVIYGPKMENKNVIIDEMFVVKHSNSKYESSIFQTKSGQGDLNSLKVMIKKIQTHPMSRRPVHVDLYALDMNAKIRVHINLKFIGEPVGVKEEGGVRQIVMRDVEIECNPSDIPEAIEVDISQVKLGTSLHVSDINFPAGAKPITAGDRTIVTVNLPKEDKPEAPVAAAGDAAAPAAGAAPAADAAKADKK